MEVKIFCANCKVEILRADTDTLRSPLIGNMFKVKKDMEWSMFSPHDNGNDLLCPMCDWAFHENGKLMIPVNGDFVFGKPEVVIPGIIAQGEWKVPEAHYPYPYVEADKVLSSGPIGGVAKEETHLPLEQTSEGSIPSSASKDGIYKCSNQAHLPNHGNLPVPCDRCEKLAIEIPTITIERQNQNKIDEQFTEPDNTLNNLMDKVEGNQSDEEKSKTPSDSVIQSIQDQVEVKEKEPEKPEPPTINNGDWSDNLDTNEASETMGRAPSGTVPAEESDEMSGKAPPGTKVADSGKIKFKGSKRSRAFFRKAKV